jgi:hypothetical protein
LQELLHATLDEEKRADQGLTLIAQAVSTGMQNTNQSARWPQIFNYNQLFIMQTHTKKYTLITGAAKVSALNWQSNLLSMDII